MSRFVGVVMQDVGNFPIAVMNQYRCSPCQDIVRVDALDREVVREPLLDEVPDSRYLDTVSIWILKGHACVQVTSVDPPPL